MANRRSNKKLRALTRARMAATGESYQRARSLLMAQHAAGIDAASEHGEVDLVECTFYGVPITLATFQDPKLPRIVVVPRFQQPYQQGPQGAPWVWMRFLQPRGVQ